MDDILQLILRQGENHRNRLQLADDDKAGRIGGVHDVARVDQPEADASRDRRGNARVDQIELGALDLPLIARRGALRNGLSNSIELKDSAELRNNVTDSTSRDDFAGE